MKFKHLHEPVTPPNKPLHDPQLRPPPVGIISWTKASTEANNKTGKISKRNMANLMSENKKPRGTADDCYPSGSRK